MSFQSFSEISSLVINYRIMVIDYIDQNSVNHAGFDDVKKNLLDNECHHQKGGECESCMFKEHY